MTVKSESTLLSKVHNDLHKQPPIYLAASSPANHSFIQQIWNTYYMPDTVLGIWDTSVTKQKEKDLYFCGTYIIFSFFEGVEVGGKEQRQTT